MKKWTAFPKFFLTVGVFLLLLFFNVGSLRCESPVGGTDNLSPQAKNDHPALEKDRNRSWLENREEKNERFKVLEWLIKQQLLAQYEKMEINEDLDN